MLFISPTRLKTKSFQGVLELLNAVSMSWQTFAFCWCALRLKWHGVYTAIDLMWAGQELKEQKCM